VATVATSREGVAMPFQKGEDPNRLDPVEASKAAAEARRKKAPPAEPGVPADTIPELPLGKYYPLPRTAPARRCRRFGMCF
jgi:hypothetical protein